MLGVIYRDVEARALELEEQVRKLRQLFKPWPPPRQLDDEPQPVKTVDPVPPPPEVIPEEEQAELDRIEKLLSKAQIARNTHRKTTRELQKEANPVMPEQAQIPTENSADRMSFDQVNGQCIQVEYQETGNRIHPKHVSKQNTTVKTSVSLVSKEKKTETSTNIRKVTDKGSSKTTGSASVKSRQAVTEKPNVSQGSRPISSSGRGKVVPAHISAPFQTNPNLRTSRLQTTYRSATIVKSTVRGRGGATSSGRGRGDRGSFGRPGSSSGRATSSSSSKSGSAGSNRDRNTNSTTKTTNTASASNDRTDERSEDILKIDKQKLDRDSERLGRQSEGLESRDKVRHKQPKNRVEDNRNDKLSPCYTVIDNQTVIERISGVEHDVAGATETDQEVDKLFNLRRDGSTIELPTKLRKYFSQNTKLRRKYHTASLTGKVDSPSASHSFSELLNQCDKCGYGERIQSLARSAETIANTYTQLHSVLDSLHLPAITDASTALELLYCKKLLEFILTDYQEAEEIFHSTDYRLLRSVPADIRPVNLKTETACRSPAIWYNKFSGIPGHRSPDTVVYNSSKDLERYRSLMFQNQLAGAQLDIREYAAKIILPLLRSLEPGSSEFVCVLRCGYELLLKSSNSSPVIVKDTIDEECDLEW